MKNTIKLFFSILISLVCSGHLALAGGREGSGGGDIQLVQYLKGPQTDRFLGEFPVFQGKDDERVMVRLFFGSASWGLDVLSALEQAGFDFSLRENEPHPISKTVLRDARQVLLDLESRGAVKLSGEPLTGLDGTQRWAVNFRESQSIVLNRSAWVFSGVNLRNSCAVALGTSFEVGGPSVNPLQMPVQTAAHCYQMLSAAIATHEVLSLMGIESDGHYPYSAFLMAFVKNPWRRLQAARIQIDKLVKQIHLQEMPDREERMREGFSDPLLTLLFSYYQGSIEELKYQWLRQSSNYARKPPPTGTYDYYVYPAIEGETPLLDRFQQEKNFSEMKPLLQEIQRVLRLERVLSVHLPVVPTLWGVPMDTELLSTNDYYRTPGYWLVDKLLKETKIPANASKTQRLKHLTFYKNQLKEVLEEISYEHSSSNYKILVIDYVYGLTKKHLGQTEQQWNRQWRHVHAFSYQVYMYAKSEKRRFIESTTLDLLLSLRGRIKEQVKEMLSGNLTFEERETLQEFQGWLDSTRLQLEIIGGLERRGDGTGTPSSSFRIEIHPHKAWRWFRNELQSLAGETFSEYGVSIAISSRRPDGSYVISSLKDQDDVSVQEFIQRLDVRNTVRGTGMEPPRQRTVFRYLASYLSWHPEDFHRGVCTDGVVLSYHMQGNHWAILSHFYGDILAKNGAPESLHFSAPRTQVPQEWVQRSLVKVEFPLGE